MAAMMKLSDKSLEQGKPGLIIMTLRVGENAWRQNRMFRFANLQKLHS